MGDLCLFKDSTGVRGCAVMAVSLSLVSWLRTCLFRAARWGGPTRVLFGGGIREPDDSFYVGRRREPNVVVEMGYVRPRPRLLAALADWTAPVGPARVSIALSIDIDTPAGTPPGIEVMMQLEGQQRPSVTISCGAGSGCRSWALYDYTLFVPLAGVLYGAPRLTWVLAHVWLAVFVPLYSVTWGVLYAALDLLYGRRTILGVASACLRSLRGPWWGVVPLDTFKVRRVVFWELGVQHRIHTSC
ncbi:hypothetical protein HYH03_018461 [Edaphochlamys debaryana]|uniref:Uncharacterized protein n=1 Tax=Edaphochlamys debaryana TaxID=47281 RepID=A0A836BPD3_9CHLO|nr:hypothetical protein HYH03_018461 [Edaphochlamys debaryana]|eukprot:KAG2482619.1 hypothetical protein HYH03_018461 [Edaphochlamys debaryana]